MAINNLAANVADAMQILNDTKNAAVSKGQTWPQGTPYSQLPSKVSAIPVGTGGGGGEDPALGFVPTEWSADGLITKGRWVCGGAIPIICFANCSGLVKADLGPIPSIAQLTFVNASKLETLILRKDSLVALYDVNAFNATPIASGTGYVYVPATLVDAYKGASNWITYAGQIRAIEAYPEITGG